MTWDPTSTERFRANHFADPERYPAAQAIEGFRTDPVTAALINNLELYDPIGGDPAARYALGIHYLAGDAEDSTPATEGLPTLDGQWIPVRGAEGMHYFNDNLDNLPTDALAVHVKYHDCSRKLADAATAPHHGVERGVQRIFEAWDAGLSGARPACGRRCSVGRGAVTWRAGPGRQKQ